MENTFLIEVRGSPGELSPDWPSGAPGQRGDALLHAFQTRTFLEVWLESFGRTGRQSFHFVEVRDRAGRPLLLVPLRIIVAGGARLLQFIDHEAADYNAPVLFSSGHAWTRESAKQLWQQIVAKLPPVDVVELTKMPGDVEGVDNPLFLLGSGAGELSCHATDLRRPWAEIDREVPRRTTLLRKIRGLERISPLGFHVAETAEEVRRVTEVMLRQKQRRFEETMVPGFDVDRDKFDFFDKGTARFHQQGMLKLFYLTSGDNTIVATIWGLTSEKRYYAIMLSFEGDEWTRHSPGSILFYKALEWLHRNGYEWMDLGIGDEPWKLESCRTTIPLVERREALTPRGRLHMARMKLTEAVRRTQAYQRLRPLKWVVLRKIRGR